MTEVLRGMIGALGLEVEASRRRSGGQSVDLRGGERVGEADKTWLYRFPVPENVSLRDETPIRITIGQESVAGTLVSLRDGILVIALDKDLGAEIRSARLTADDAFLIERLKERLAKVLAGEAILNRAAADRVLGVTAPKAADADLDPAVLQDGTANPAQVLAVRRALGSDTCYIWGPPGTGKTTTLARIVEAHYRAGRSVLLVSNTNIAVDTALERVAERLEGESEFHQGLVIREGPVVKEELRSRFGAQVILEEIVARLGATLREERDSLRQDAAPLERDESSMAEALSQLAQLEEARSGLATRQQTREAALLDVVKRETEAERERDKIPRLKQDLGRAQGMGTLRRFLSGLDPAALERDIAAADRSAQAAADAARAISARLDGLATELAALATRIEQLKAETQSYPDEGPLRKQLSTLQERLGQIRDRVSKIDAELAELEKQVLARCRILATTIYRTYLSPNTLRQFDAVVIDEASMLTPPLVYYAAGLSKESVTVAGDFRQLPPIVMSDEPLAAEWLKKDVFEKAGIPQRLREGKPTPHLVSLSVQYRMREPICGLVNELFYPDRPLTSDASVRRQGDDFPLSEAPLLYIDTEPFHPWAALRAGSYSRYNLFHALLLRNIVVHLADQGFLPEVGLPNEAVGVVTPYASQAQLIQDLLDDRLGARAAGIAATVHRFQGNEKQVMLLDLPDSTGVRLGRFLHASAIEDDGARLLNVATSRARNHVVLVANFGYLRSNAPAGGYVQRLLAYLQEHGESLDVAGLLPLADRDWIDGLGHFLPPTFDLPEGATGAFTDETFYEAFQRDLARARESIVLFSPFITPRGTNRWVELLRGAVGRGVQVRILTCPPQERDTRQKEVVEVLGGLRDLGITVDLRQRMHEKIAILDGRVLWHGSLNILSHRDTRESMLRIESPSACERLALFFTPPGRWHEEENGGLETRENPRCPDCGGATVWYDGRFGIYYVCEDGECGGRIDPRRRGRAGGAAKSQEGHGKPGQTDAKMGGAQGRPCPEPGCDGHLVERNGRYGPFLGCTRYPKCRHTENLGQTRTMSRCGHFGGA
jgi:ssDNA-binding Zn-finger/Zn-ribbon topoisomerase 1